ncbi:MAG: hypothetical protein K6G09_08925 [Treponema sp.]|nr:hypothetical protein [Treponema sp.]
MNANGIIVRTNQLLTNGIKSQFLKNGSQVLVRVLSQLPNGKYEGSVAGVRINFSSNKPLLPGSSFTANVLAKNGVIQLVPKQTGSIQPQNQQNPLQNQFQLQNNILQNQNLTSLLNSLGLPADSLSVNLLQQMQQLEMKFDLSLLGKIRNLALRIKGKEKLASQLLMILAEKGLEADKESLEKLLNELFGDFEEEKNHQNAQKNMMSQQKNNNQKVEKDEKNDYELLNDFNSKKGKWYFLPFEIINLSQAANQNQSLNQTSTQNKTQVLGKGVIKLLYNSDNTNLLMTNLSCACNNKNYLFNLFFESNKCTSLAVNISPSDESEIEKLLGSLKQSFAAKNINLDVFWADKEKLEGSACGFESIFSVEGEA